MATNSKFAVARSRCLRVNLWRLRPSRFCRLHVCRYTWEVADLRTKNPAHHEPAILQGARSVSQADRAFQNRQGRAAACAWRFTAFSEREDSLDGCVVELDRR